MRTGNRILTILAISLGLALTACSKAPGGGGGQDSGTGVVLENRIAATVNAANTGEIQLSKLAQDQAMDPEVKTFADRMVTEHTATQQRQQQLFARLGITPMDNDTSKALKDEANTMSDRLKKLSGADFDKEYIAGQVTLHQRVLDLVDREYLPKVQQPELKDDLQRMRDDINAHLQAAQKLQDRLGKPTLAP